MCNYILEEVMDKPLQSAGCGVSRDARQRSIVTEQTFMSLFRQHANKC